ncbi:MAG: (Fe-S)-binding protein [Candidatus Thermoplasmatota archaeon]|nr:(Fe-S)-binding protein [Candidatus Thermoplasmatota archaeon]
MIYLFSVLLLSGLLVSIALFFYSVYEIIWYALKIPLVKKRLIPDIPRRIYIFIRNVIFQGKLFKNLSGGIMHSLFFWGFLAFGFYSIYFLSAGVDTSLRLFGPGIGSDVIFYTVDLFALIVLVDVIYSVLRRWVFKVKRYQGYNGFEAYFILILIAGLMVTYYILGVLRIDGATSGIPGAILTYLPAGMTPVTNAIASVLPRATGPFAYYAYWSTWAVHSLIFIVFLAYIPRSKHLHLFAAPLNVLFSDRKQSQLTVPDFQKDSRFGATDIRDFSWKDYFDFYACTECGRCTANCPANLTGKTLSPRDIIWDLRKVVLSQGKMVMNGEDPEKVIKPVIGEPILEKDLWSCTTCMACVEQCPTMIDHVPKIINMRRSLVLNQGSAPREVIDLYRNLEQYGSPYSMDPATRGDWAKGLGVTDLSEGEGDYDVLFWVGCVQSFDRRNQEIARSFAGIMKKAGIRFAILGKEERCTGDPARRTGNEYLAQDLIMKNVEKLKTLRVRKVVTACPHCFNSLKNDYRDFGIELEVMHHTQFINSLLSEGKITLRQIDSDKDDVFTYHDPCYLGRWNKEYDAPRGTVKQFALDYREMEMSKSRSLCCGAGGGRLWMQENEGTMISNKRILMAEKTGATRLVTACPYCMTMLDDARKTANLENKIKMNDIAELVYERLK